MPSAESHLSQCAGIRVYLCVDPFARSGLRTVGYWESIFPIESNPPLCTMCSIFILPYLFYCNLAHAPHLRIRTDASRTAYMRKVSRIRTFTQPIIISINSVSILYNNWVFFCMCLKWQDITRCVAEAMNLLIGRLLLSGHEFLFF